jgi:hypothetical protein
MVRVVVVQNSVLRLNRRNHSRVGGCLSLVNEYSNPRGSVFTNNICSCFAFFGHLAVWEDKNLEAFRIAVLARMVFFCEAGSNVK